MNRPLAAAEVHHSVQNVTYETGAFTDCVSTVAYGLQLGKWNRLRLESDTRRLDDRTLTDKRWQLPSPSPEVRLVSLLILLFHITLDVSCTSREGAIG